MSSRREGNSEHGLWRRAYRALLPLMPRGLRARQGDAMLDLFDRELRRSEPDGSRAVWAAGLTGLADLARRGAYERLSEERQALTTANVTILRRTAFAFISTSAALTALFVAKGAVTRAAAPLSDTAFDVILFSIPYTAAFTIPMSVFLAVLWAGSRKPTAAYGDDPAVSAGAPRLAPVIGMASAVALCCLALNAELVPRANLRLQSIYAGGVAVAPSDRSMTLHELREAEARLVRAPRAVTALDSDGASVASYEVEIQKKFALAAACVLLALLATGIASRASRISLWAQVGISLVVFSGYYMCIITGEQLADRSAIPPVLAMWSANIVVLVIAMLTLRVARGVRDPAVRMPSQAV
ncbi:MAG: LptF/LptG family permease [Gemmatimonadaceae bacterium]|nr:LptF/LptG family permease [Gemmatimonadaceae bacterium]